VVQQAGLGVVHGVGDLLQRGVRKTVAGEEAGGTVEDLGVYFGFGGFRHGRFFRYGAFCLMRPYSAVRGSADMMPKKGTTRGGGSARHR